jgi:hypothetical protein
MPLLRKRDRKAITVKLLLLCLFFVLAGAAAVPSSGRNSPPTDRPASGGHRPRTGRVRVQGHAVADNGGAFPGLGASYFSALWRCKHDRERLGHDLDFLSRQGFHFIRVLAMVGWNGAWDGREIAPVSFTSREGKEVRAWPDYWRQLRDLIDTAYDRHGLRTQITLFADAQLMPVKADRIAFMQRVLTDVVPGREHKIMLLEVANEAWQNGFPGKEGIADLREFTKYLADRTALPVATTSNHEDSFTELYAGSAADLATWHFSRDKRPNQGWEPVYDCWRLGDLPGMPPVSSNEPIGPGSSVSTESDPLRLVTAAAFAYVAKLPIYVFHSEAGVFGRKRFEEMSGIGSFRPLLKLLPGDVANWERHDALEADALFGVYAGGKESRYWSEEVKTPDGCVRSVDTRKGNRFLCLPLGIQPGGVRLRARQSVKLQVYHPLTGKVVMSATRPAGGFIDLPQGPGAYLIKGTITRPTP